MKRPRARRPFLPARAAGRIESFADAPAEDLMASYVSLVRDRSTRLATPWTATAESTLRRAIAERAALELATRPHLTARNAVLRAINSFQDPRALDQVLGVVEAEPKHRVSEFFGVVLELIMSVAFLFGPGLAPRIVALVAGAVHATMGVFGRRKRSSAAGEMPAVRVPVDVGEVVPAALQDRRARPPMP